MLISQKISQSLTDTMIQNDVITKEEREIYIYCYDYILEQLLYTAIILSLGFLFHEFLVAFLFVLMFSSMRFFGGGYHAPTEFSCTVISFTVYLSVLFLAPAIAPHYSFLWLIAFLLSAVIILILAPVDTPNKRLTMEQRKIMKRNCILFCALFFILFLILFYKNSRLYYGTLAICAILIAVSLLLGVLANQIYEKSDTSS